MSRVRVQSMVLLSAAQVRSRIWASRKTQDEIAEWCLCSDRQVRNWCAKDTNVSVSMLYSLADCLGCNPDDLLVRIPMPEKRE